MKVIYSKIVADLFHTGHVNFLREARSRGDKLVVHVVDDERVTSYKGRPVMSQQERISVVASCCYVDEVVAEGPKVITKAFLDQHGYAAYAFGYANETEKAAKMSDCSDLPSDRIEIIDYTSGVSSSNIKKRILKRSYSLSAINRKKLLFYLIFMVVTVIGTMLIDRGFSLVYDFSTESAVQRGIHFVPNSSTTLETIEFSYTITANSFGLRSPEIDPAKSDSTFRVVVLGDSWTMGYGVQNNEAWPQQVQQLVADKENPHIQIVNAARSGSGPREYLETLKKTVDIFKPDLILVGLLQINDLTDLLLNEDPGVIAYRESSVRSKIKSAIKRFWPNTVSIVSQWRKGSTDIILKTRYIDIVKTLKASFTPVERIRYNLLPADVKSRFESGDLNPQILRLYIYFPERPFIFNESENEKVDEVIKNLMAIIDEMKQISDSAGSAFAVLHLPMNFYTGQQVIRNTFDQVLPQLTNQARLDSFMARELETRQIEHLILTEAFSTSSSDQPLFFLYDGHPTVQGHSLIASEVIKWDFFQDMVRTLP